MSLSYQPQDGDVDVVVGAAARLEQRSDRLRAGHGGAARERREHHVASSDVHVGLRLQQDAHLGGRARHEHGVRAIGTQRVHLGPKLQDRLQHHSRLLALRGRHQQRLRLVIAQLLAQTLQPFK